MADKMKDLLKKKMDFDHITKVILNYNARGNIDNGKTRKRQFEYRTVYSLEPNFVS